MALFSLSKNNKSLQSGKIKTELIFDFYKLLISKYSKSKKKLNEETI